MFHLLTIEDRVRIPPNNFNSEVQTIEDEIEKKYVSKVVLNGGLFIALYDILGTGDSYVYPGDGAAHLMVRFRMVVFKPFKGEIMEGVIKKSTKDQVQITLGFYDEIYLNPIELPTPSSFSEDESLWYWDWNDNQLFFENGGRIRFRVEQIEFNPEVSQPAPAPKNLNTDGMDAYTLKEYKERQLENERLLQQVKSPLILKVSVKDSGLGMVEWWTGQDATNDDDNDDNDDNTEFDQQKEQEDQDQQEYDYEQNYQQLNTEKNNFDEGESVEDAANEAEQQLEEEEEEEEQVLVNKKNINNSSKKNRNRNRNHDLEDDEDQVFDDIEEEEVEEEEEEEKKSRSKSKSKKKDSKKSKSTKKDSKKSKNRKNLGSDEEEEEPVSSSDSEIVPPKRQAKSKKKK